MQHMTCQILLYFIHSHQRCQFKIFCNKSVSNMPLNVIKERKIKLSANKFYQIIYKMWCFLQNFIRYIIDIKLVFLTNFITKLPFFHSYCLILYVYYWTNNMFNSKKKKYIIQIYLSNNENTFYCTYTFFLWYCKFLIWAYKTWFCQIRAQK